MVALIAVVAISLAASTVALEAPGARVAFRHHEVSRGIQPRNGETTGLPGQGSHVAARLPRATAAPPPAPPAVSQGAPLRAHEVFGFAPYWTLDEATGFDVAGYTTLAYFSLTSDGTGKLQSSGTGWDGFESQAFADLVGRAHAAGDRVVLTISCFTQRQLDQLTASPTAAKTLATSAVKAIEAKHLDGVNLDLEGAGAADQAGLTAVVRAVATAVRAADPHDQVTMDTYASSAGDPNGFYDIPALANVVDAFFVMSYGLNLQAGTSPLSPLTSQEFSDAQAVQQYAAAVPAAKVILGTAFFGYEWATTNGTMAARSSGAATPAPVSYAQVVAGGAPLYWDDVTDTAWTSYEVGGQWHESYVETPVGVYLVSQLAAHDGLGGVGAWALGMDGNDPAMVTALDGNRPATQVGGPGPVSTTASIGAAGPVPRAHRSPGAPLRSVPGPTGPTRSVHSRTTGGVTTTSEPPQTTSTTAGSAASTTTSPPSSTSSTSGVTTTTSSGGPAPFRYSGLWQGEVVSMTPVPPTTPLVGSATLVGMLTGFATNDPAVSCIGATVQLDVWRYTGGGPYFVEPRSPADCVTATFSFSPTATSPTATSPTAHSPGGG